MSLGFTATSTTLQMPPGFFCSAAGVGPVVVGSLPPAGLARPPGGSLHVREDPAPPSPEQHFQQDPGTAGALQKPGKRAGYFVWQGITVPRGGGMNKKQQQVLRP